MREKRLSKFKKKARLEVENVNNNKKIGNNKIANPLFPAIAAYPDLFTLVTAFLSLFILVTALLVLLSSLLFFSVFFFHCCFPQSFNLQLCPSQLYQRYQRFCHCLSWCFCPYLSFFIFFPGPPHYSYLFLSNASSQINFAIISKSLYSPIFCQPIINIQIIITTRYR